MKVLVTGGGGFLGKAIVRLLKARGDEVRSYSRGSYPELEAIGVDCIQGDLTDPAALSEAVAGVDAVIHCAAKAGFWGPYEQYYAANVVGTRNLLAACRRHGVRRLVHTSSPSVVFDGRDMEGVDESVPYPAAYKAAYPATKAEAERLVLSADGPGFSTVALRPHLVWGPGDPHITPRLTARARAGLLRRIGDRPNKVDSTFVDNAAEAHVLALDALGPGSACAGKAYFISNGEPMPLWDLVNALVQAGGAPPVTRTVSPAVAWFAGWLLETLYRLLPLKGEPRMTRWVASELSTAHWFDLSAAERDLGYRPRVSIAEGLKKLKSSYSGPEAVRA